MRLAIACLLLPLTLAAQSKAEDTATVSGTVTNALTGEPLRRALVTLRRTVIARNATTISGAGSAYTDATGRFTIKGIEPGDYRMSAERSGFLTQGYGSRTPLGSGALLTFSAGQKMEGVSLHLSPHGVITGRVLEDDGEPAVEAAVQILRQQYTNGKKQLTAANSALTNDLGEYRIFGIKPGRYWVLAHARTVPNNPEEDEYVTTFFPRTTDPTAATPVEVTPGAQVRNIDLALRRMHTVSVRGRVLSELEAATTGANSRCTVVLAPVSNVATGGASRSNACSADGTFEIKSVLPGAYTLNAFSVGAQQNLAARVPVQVGSANVDNLSITIRRGVPISGNVTVDGDVPLDTKRIGLLLPPFDPEGLVLSAPPSPRLKEDGSFEANDVRPERYRVTLSNLPEGWYIKSIRSGQADVLLDGLEITGASPSPIEVVLSPHAARVSGVVTGTKSQKPVPAAMVVLVPEDKARVGNSLYYRNILTDASGRYTFIDIPPGDYRVYAWDEVEVGAWVDPDFLKGFEGEKVSLDENAQVNLQLKLDIVE